MEPVKYPLVIDLEATCDERHAIPREETEIIEIGAVLLDEALRPIEEWQTFVRPQQHPLLTKFCMELTSIQQSDVDGAPTFPEAIAALGRFIAGRNVLFCSWGDYDRVQFGRDAQRHGVALPLGQDHLNVKIAFSKALGQRRRMGVGQAIARLGLTFEGTAHRGIDDARNIARLPPYALGRVPFPALG